MSRRIKIGETGLIICDRAFDIVMKQALNAKERDADDWTRLLQEADPRFKLTEVIQPRGSVLAIIVVDWEA